MAVMVLIIASLVVYSKERVNNRIPGNLEQYKYLYQRLQDSFLLLHHCSHTQILPHRVSPKIVESLWLAKREEQCLCNERVWRVWAGEEARKGKVGPCVPKQLAYAILFSMLGYTHMGSSPNHKCTNPCTSFLINCDGLLFKLSLLP